VEAVSALAPVATVHAELFDGSEMILNHEWVDVEK
jgi:hypothetical protein